METSKPNIKATLCVCDVNEVVQEWHTLSARHPTGERSKTSEQLGCKPIVAGMELEDLEQLYRKLVRENKILNHINKELKKDIEIFQKSIQGSRPEMGNVRMYIDSPPWQEGLVFRWTLPKDIEILQVLNAELQTRNKQLARDKMAAFRELVELKRPRKAETGTQTEAEPECQDVEYAHKLLLQEKETWQAKKKELQEELSLLQQQNCEAVESERRALREHDVLQEHNILQRTLQEMQLRAYRRLQTLQEEPNEFGAAQSLNQLLLQEFTEHNSVLREWVRLLEEKVHSPPPSRWSRLISFFTAGGTKEAADRTRRTPSFFERISRIFRRLTEPQD